LSGLFVSVAILTKEYAMNDSLSERAADLSRLAMTISTTLDCAEDTIRSLNHTLAELASLGVRNFQITGPVVYARPANTSSDEDDLFILFQAVLLMPGGVGAAAWDSVEYTEHLGRPHGEPADLRPRFVPYADCLPLVRAMLVAHVGEMLDRLMRDVRLAG
jgi:hypothetical protein